MKAKYLGLILFLAAIGHVGPSWAQGVYMTRGENGPVFSDKPQSGAKQLSLKPLTIVPPARDSRSSALPANAPAVESSKPEVLVPGYRRFVIVSPEDGGSVLANTAVFEVRLDVEPPLQLGAGHGFVVNINGRPVNQRFTASEFMIPPEFWGEFLPPVNQAMQLDASLVDGNGQVLKRAAPVRFYMRHTMLHNKPLRPVHVPRPPIKPPPKTKPELRPEAAAVLH